MHQGWLACALAILTVLPGCLQSFGGTSAPPAIDVPPGLVVTPGGNLFQLISGCATSPPAGDGKASVGFATSASRTLLRWTSAGEGKTYTIERADGSALGAAPVKVATVAAATEATAPGLVDSDPRWTELYVDLLELLGAATWSEAQAKLAATPFQASELSMRYYPIALALGVGWLDPTAVSGKTYTYRVSTAGQAIGVVTLVAGIATPTPAPRNLAAVDVGPDAPSRVSESAPWEQRQADRRFDGDVYLAWDPPCYPAGATGVPATWIAGYDVWRRPVAGTEAAQRVNGEEPVQPMPKLAPAPGLPDLSFYYADHVPVDVEFEYRVASRDALGHTPTFADAPTRFSEPATAHSYDTMPPPPVTELAATKQLDPRQVKLTWKSAEPGAQHVVFRTTSFDASELGLGCDESVCWRILGSTAGTELIDATPELDTLYWYRVVSRDAAFNPSAPAGPVHALFEDTSGPVLTTRSGTAGIIIAAAGAAARIEIQCFLEGQWVTVYDDEGFAVEVSPSGLVPAAAADVGTECQAVGYNEDGDAGPPVPVPAGDTFVTPPPAKPFLLPVQSAAGGAEVRWDTFEAPKGSLSHFILARTVVAYPVQPWPANVTVTKPAESRFHLDTGLDAKATYRYTVTAVNRLELPYNGQSTISDARDFQRLTLGVRSLAILSCYSATVDLDAPEDVLIDWACPVTPADPFGAAHGWWAVFRSHAEDEGFLQITPVYFGRRGHVDVGVGSDTNLWYQVVQYDGRTGEPIGTTPAFRSGVVTQGVLRIGYDNLAPDPAPGECTGVLPLGHTLHWAGGFSLSVTDWIRRDADNLTGAGTVTVGPVGATTTLTATFENVTVGDATGHVCVGEAVFAGGSFPVSVARPNELEYTISALSLRPWFDASGVATATVGVTLPSSMRFFRNGAVTSTFLIGHAVVAPDLTFDADGSMVVESFAPPCTAATTEFRLLTLPFAMQTFSPIIANETGIYFGDTCLRYVDPFDPSVFVPARPPLGDLWRADANDGWMRTKFTSTAAATASPSGLAGAWTAEAGTVPTTLFSSPYGLQLKIDGGLNFTMAESRIFDGNASAARARIHYWRAPGASVSFGAMSVPLPLLTIGRDGLMVAEGIYSGTVSWLSPPAWSMPTGAWTLVVGRATVDEPGTAAWIAVSGHELGFNRRQDHGTLSYANCGGPPVTFADTAMDVYVRHSGISGTFATHLPADGVAVSLHGYPATLSTLELAWMDDVLVSRSASAALGLPAPAGVHLDLVNLGFDAAGCVDSGQIASGANDVELLHWRQRLTVSSVIWNEANAWQLTLRSLLDLPRLGGGEGPHGVPAVPADVTISPAGQLVGAVATYYDDPTYTVDGFPYALTSLRLSDIGEAAGLADVGARPAPECPDPCGSGPGFQVLEGRLYVPFFGKLAGGAEGRSPSLVTYGGTGPLATSLGFRQVPSVSRVWTENAVAGDTIAFASLVYAPGAAGRFVGYSQLDVPSASAAATLVLDAGAKPHLLFGVGAGLGAYRALTPSGPATEADRARWNGLLAIPTVEANVAAALDGLVPAATTVAGVTDALTPELLKANVAETVGGGTTGGTYDRGILLWYLRGHGEFSAGPTYQLDAVRLVGEMALARQPPTPGATLDFAAIRATALYSSPRAEVVATRSGAVDFTNDAPAASMGGFIGPAKVTTFLTLEPSVLFEGSVEMGPMDLYGLEVKTATFITGIGENVRYIGALLDASMPDPSGGGGVHMGGSLVLGSLNPQAPLLNEKFPDLMSKLADLGAAPGNTVDGFYVRVYGDFPVYSNGCALSVNVGGEVAFWYFATPSGEDQVGGRLRGYVFGIVLCLVQARGDLTIEVYHTSGEGEGSGTHFKGQGWIAAGIGDCDAAEWGPNWEPADDEDGRWWDDSWCLQAGAFLLVTKDGDGAIWDVTYGEDFESPF